MLRVTRRGELSRCVVDAIDRSGLTRGQRVTLLCILCDMRSLLLAVDDLFACERELVWAMDGAPVFPIQRRRLMVRMKDIRSTMPEVVRRRTVLCSHWFTTMGYLRSGELSSASVLL